MTRQFIMCLAMILAFCNSAFADPAAVVKAHSDAFGAAFTACNVPATLRLYEDNAVMIWRRTGKKESRMRCWTDFWRDEIRRRCSKPEVWLTS